MTKKNLKTATRSRERQRMIDEAIDQLKALRKRTGKITVKQLKATIHAGHRY